MRIFFSGLILTSLLINSGCNQSTTASSDIVSSDSVSAPDKPLAFPGAEGFGKYTTGGRGGEVLIVTNLNNEGTGSLREAIRVKEPRIIVFSVSGTIALESPLDINYGNLTIAGQSAPGGGITLRNYPIKIKGENVIIRYIRSRMGNKNNVQDDAISAIGQKNIIIDHCTFSWGTDECASFYDNENFTLQWSIISESLNNSVHEKGEHGYGGIWGGKGATFHHNLLAHHQSRNPRFNGARTYLQQQPEKEIVDFRNNVIYNWRSNSAYAGERGNYNIVNNYYKSGPATEESKRDRIVNPWTPFGNFYVAGNYMEGFPEVIQDNWKGVQGEYSDSALVSASIQVVAIPEQSAEAALEVVLADAGASYIRDAVDQRIVQEVWKGETTFGRNGIIDSQSEVGGWPELERQQSPQDRDKDGMPDEWEKKKGLDPENAKDHIGYNLNNTYTNLEVYLNELVEINNKL